MNKISTILAVVAIVLAATLYFVQSRQIQELKKHATTEQKPVANSNFRIAYFDLDSLQAHYDEFKDRSEEHTSELQSHSDLVCRLLLQKKKWVRDLLGPGRAA